MAFWEEKEERELEEISDAVVDLSFRIHCRSLPVDHGWPLSQAVIRILPWLPEEPNAALHQILVAESGNGWLSPEKGDALLYPSRRTRLMVRLPKHRVEEAIEALDGTTLSVGGHPITLSQPETRLLSKLTTLYTRFAIFHEDESEQEFLQRIRQELAARDIHPTKMICGLKNLIRTGDNILRTQSLMLADLTPQEAISLQQMGLSEGKDFGCGLFLPHKTVENRLSER